MREIKRYSVSFQTQRSFSPRRQTCHNPPDTPASPLLSAHQERAWGGRPPSRPPVSALQLGKCVALRTDNAAICFPDIAARLGLSRFSALRASHTSNL